MSKPTVIFPDGQHINWDQVAFHPLATTGGILWTYIDFSTTGSYNAGSPYLANAMLKAITDGTSRGDNVVDLSALFAVTIISLATSPFGAGDTVTVTGTGFKTGATVRIGGQLVPGIITVSSLASLSFIAPDRTLEPFLSVYNQKNPQDILITNLDGTSFGMPNFFSWS